MAIRYSFGIDPTKSVEQQFIDHYNVCISCKNENTWTQKQEEVKEEKVIDTYMVRSCSCGATWIPRKATKENLQKFKIFMNYGNKKK